MLQMGRRNTVFQFEELNKEEDVVLGTEAARYRSMW
jgi:hypothetical protein